VYTFDVHVTDLKTIAYINKRNIHSKLTLDSCCIERETHRTGKAIAFSGPSAVTC